jgi:tripartite-type tricarboxylate transporter receptor subunit TctC
MKLARRRFMHLVAGAAAVAAFPQSGFALDYPTRPVRIVVGFSPGGAPDIVARLLGQWLTERLGQTFIVENRGGAGGNIGAEAVVRAAPDGYTLLLVATNDAINATLYDKLNFNFIRDIEPVAGIVRTPFVLEIHPSVPAQSVPELIAYAKANPGKLSMASPGAGSGPHMAGELFRLTAGLDVVHVPYRGAGAALSDMLAGQVQIVFTSIPASNEFVRTGKLRALAITTATRASQMPDVPPLGDFLPGYESSLWTGIGLPKNSPAEIVSKLNREINAALEDPKFKARLADFGGISLAGSPADFGKLIASETEKWAKVVKSSGMKPE